MRQRALLEEDDEPAPRPRRVESGEDVVKLLEQMATIMHYRTDRGLKWYARALEGATFAEADSAVEAMCAALKGKV